MSYTFPTPIGRITGEWKTVTPDAVEASLWILYDPEHPEHNVPFQF